MEVAAALEASALASALRGAQWVYPMVNAAHVLGVAMLVGAAIPMDLRLAGFWRRDMPLDDVLRLLWPIAGAGLALAVGSGALLFIVQARDYAAMPLFALKLVLIAVALVNALASGRRVLDLAPAAQRRVGAASLALWIGALMAGRMLGYV